MNVRSLLPISSGLYPVDHGCADAKFLSYLSVWRDIGSDIHSLLSSYFHSIIVKMMTLSIWEISAGVSGVPAFFRKVFHIVSLSAKKQVIRPDALRIVAGVKNIHPILYRAVLHNPRNSVRKNIIRKKCSRPKVPVSLPIEAGNPLPARVGFFDLRKKEFLGLFDRKRFHNFLLFPWGIIT